LIFCDFWTVALSWRERKYLYQAEQLSETLIPISAEQSGALSLSHVGSDANASFLPTKANFCNAQSRQRPIAARLKGDTFPVTPALMAAAYRSTKPRRGGTSLS